MNSRPATSAPFSERRSSLDCDHLDSEDFVSSEESHELHEADVSSTTREPGATRQSEAAVGGHEAPLVKAKAAKLLKGKEKEWESMVQRARPLQLLDLPVDILKEIIKEVTHTNDLTSLALTHSALHNLAIPYIYSRFDIVWPEAHNTAEPRTGVDALTYGLATLVMGEEVFGDAPSPTHHSGHGVCQGFTCSHCGALNEPKPLSIDTCDPARRRRRGNYFSKYTRKFSLGNGPPDWVSEYGIAREGGKMLGTLVALAVARMPSLETFVWDMPTGVLRDVWSALSSLGDRRDGQESRLERLWVRFHDNSDVVGVSGPQQPITIPSPPPPPPAASSVGPAANSITLQTSLTGIPTPTNANTAPSRLGISYAHVEHPNFSRLPPLKSLSALDIDELAYLDEMSVLIDRSRDRLRELRIGIAASVEKKGWPSILAVQSVQPTQTHPDSHDAGMEFIAAGGVLGLVMSKIYDCRDHKQPLSSLVRENPVAAKFPSASGGIQLLVTSAPGFVVLNNNASFAQLSPAVANITTTSHVSDDHLAADSAPVLVGEVTEASTAGTESSLMNSGDVPRDDGPLNPETSAQDHNPSGKILSTGNHISSIASLPLSPAGMDESGQSQVKSASNKESTTTSTASPSNHSNRITRGDPLQKRLKLEILELERMSLHVPVLQKALDWSVITSLTILQCVEHEQLWKALRRTYSPRAAVASSPTSSQAMSKRGCQPHLRRASVSEAAPHSSSGYRLKLRRIHTDAVSPSLISFLKETLAPNSLEWMFLQEHRYYDSKVSIDAIYKGPLRRHRASLRKIMIDSERGPSENHGLSQKWRKWMFNRDVLTFVTSGKMGSLKELAMAVDYKDWHFFLQRLPQIPHLRSLYVPHIADHVYAHHLDVKELALQVVDIVTLRPEIEICYMGIQHKCFEILENRHHEDPPNFPYHDSTTSPANAGPGGVVMGDPDEDSDVDDDDHDEDDEDDDDETAAGAPAPTDADETESDVGEESNGESDDDACGSDDGKKRPKLRLREILFYDDKVSVFKARHGRL
ncbi:hypothetical protein LPUS_10611 [Lasallia pustulata]|uniref:F-box domain-containing protein n=1 Tax=Lasallia pustulata TaxID=136370 RepID=A0A1W5D9Y2_9LECA|nr:hypothetical protein LPUS_10611 [Lasallia pustulata]